MPKRRIKVDAGPEIEIRKRRYDLPVNEELTGEYNRNLAFLWEDSAFLLESKGIDQANLFSILIGILVIRSRVEDLIPVIMTYGKDITTDQAYAIAVFFQNMQAGRLKDAITIWHKTKRGK